MWQYLPASLVALALTGLLAHQFIRARESRSNQTDRLFRNVCRLIEDAQTGEGPAAGCYWLNGTYQGSPVQIRLIADTLNVRKLPSLWMMVTLPGELPVGSTFDVMLRPAGPATFSNFDRLPYDVDLPDGYPEHAILRTDDPARMLPPEILLPHLGAFRDPRAKELLVKPQGIRIVVQVAEADRVRYGVFRQAAFGEVEVEPVLVADILQTLAGMRRAIEDWAEAQ